MAKGVNKVILIGNLGKDPEVRAVGADNTACNFSIATSESWTDKTTGQKQERTEWHRISTFGKLADICGKYLKKGSKVYIEGSLRTRKWTDKEGKDNYTTEINCNTMQMLDSIGSGSNAESSGEYTPTPTTESFDDQIPF